MARIDDLEKGLVDQYGVAVKAQLDDAGNEVGDPTPLAPPAHLRRQMTMSEQIQQMIRREVSLRAQDLGYETFEEAEDFDVDDDVRDPHTPYEAVFDPPPPLKEKEDGTTAVDEGRNGLGNSGDRKPDKVGSGKSGKKPPANPAGGVPEADDGSRGAESQAE